MKDHIIICGLGHVGFRTFELLVQMNQKVILISEKIDDEWRSQIEEVGCLCLQGDARNDKLLIKANIQQAKCILALTDHDMVNVSIVMDARKLNPKIKIIARMLDTDLGEHIAEAFNVHQVFSTSELAAPMFSSGIHEKSALAQFTVDNVTYVVSEKHIDAAGESAFQLIQLKSKHKRPVQTASLVATPVSTFKKVPSLVGVRKYLNMFIEKIRYFRSPVLNNFRRFLGVLFCIVIFSTLFLESRMHLTFIDAFYFVITTVTTVGYGDISFLHNSTDLKLFGCFLMLTGAASLAMLFSSIMEMILSNKLQNLFGSQLVPKGDHVIVVGATDLGAQVISNLLEKKVAVVVMENDTTGQYPIDLKRQIAVVDGDPRSNEALGRSGVQTASAIIALMEDDVANLGVTLAAKKLNPDLMTITQIFDFGLSTKLQDEMSIDRVLSMSSVAAPYFAAAVLGEQILLAVIWKDSLVFLSQGGTLLPPSVGGKHQRVGEHFSGDIQISMIPLNREIVFSH
jgi:Trk K+ transport system NAD-binding subunit